MARSRSPVPRRSTVSPDIFWEPLTAEETQACRVLRKSCSDAAELIEDFSPSCEDSSEEVVEEVSPSTSSSSDGVQFLHSFGPGMLTPSAPTPRPASTAMPACVREQLQEERDLVNYSVPFFHPTETRFKWGGCPRHPKRSLQPHLIASGARRGVLCLRCAQFWPRHDQQKCWYEWRFPQGLFGKPAQDQKSAYACLDYALSRGSRGGAASTK